MRNILFFFLICLCGACNNDVTSIGEDLINNESYVEIKTYKIPTSTVKLDSFPTSTGYSSSTLKGLLAGRANDPITGVTITTPYFEIVPSGGSRVENTYIYDSITFNAVFNKTIWGDTTTLQQFHLYQLKATPTLNPDDDLIYNNATVPHEAEPLGSYTTWPTQERLKKFQFRLNDEVGRDLFDKLRQNDYVVQNDLDFIRYFKGPTLMADPSNTCIFGLSPAADSIGIKIHFHSSTGDLTYSFNKSKNYNQYTFMNIVNNAAGTPYAALTKQSENLPFAAAKRPNAVDGQTVTQGLSGYMIKMKLPIAPAGNKYQTIVKAEIELHPQQFVTTYYPLPKTIYFYKSDVSNKALSTVTNIAGNAVTGSLVYKPNKPGYETYIINITDFYNSLCQRTDAEQNNEVLVSIPLTEMHSSFTRLTVDEVPVLKVYYAQYE